MTTIARMRDPLAALEAVQRRRVSIMNRTDPERAHDLVQGRRNLAEKLHMVMKEGDQLLASHGDEDLLGEFRRRFSSMRSAAAALQAEWPAVRVRDHGGADYATAVATVRATDHECIAWTYGMSDRSTGKREEPRS